MFDSNKKNSIIISHYFLFYFIAIGAFMPLFSLYLQELRFSGTQIGIIASISPLMMLLIQPIWGYLADISRRFHFLLILTTILAACFSAIFPVVGSGLWEVVLLSIALSFFLSAIEPISTSIIMSYTKKYHLSYANYRLWGAVGFALSVWALSQISSSHSLSIIFYVLTSFLLVSAWYAWKLPNEFIQGKTAITKETIKKLVTNKPFIIFLSACFFVYGVMLANNSYFGFLYLSLGGTLAGVGVSFLISVGSEVPSMRLAAKILPKVDTTAILIFASFLSAVQYLFFFFHPPMFVIYVLNVAQGISMGLFIPVSVAYVQKYTTWELQTTAIVIFSGVSFGLGNWFFTLIGGFVLEHADIHYVYLLFSLVSCLGMLILIGLHMNQKKYDPSISI